MDDVKTWLYEQSSGRLFDDAGKFVATGYAGGNMGKNPEGKNNPAFESVHNIGPLPRGFYTFAPPTDDRVGPFGIPLVPDAMNQMFGRGHFYCHGDLIS